MHRHDSKQKGKYLICCVFHACIQPYKQKDTLNVVEDWDEESEERICDRDLDKVTRHSDKFKTLDGEAEKAASTLWIQGHCMGTY